MNSTPKGIGRKISIVIEEGNGDNTFNVYMEGDKERLKKGVDPKDMTPAEFWASRLFAICGEAIKKSGALQSVTSMDN